MRTHAITYTSTATASAAGADAPTSTAAAVVATRTPRLNGRVAALAASAPAKSRRLYGSRSGTPQKKELIDRYTDSMSSVLPS